MPSWLTSLFARYGYLVVLVAVLLENAGVPAPGHTVMLAGGVLAQRSVLDIAWVVAVGALAAIIGDNIGYWIGRRRGRSFLERHGRRLHLDRQRLAAVERFFARHGAKTVFIGRFITGLQTVVALFAGVSGMSWWKFFSFNASGAVVWASAYGLAGYFFGASWTVLEKWVGHAGVFLLALAVVGALIVLVLRHRETIAANMARYVPRRLVSRGGVIAVAVLGAWALFAKIAEDVTAHETTAFDSAASHAVHQLDSRFMDMAMRVFTAAGSFPMAVVLTAVVAALAFRRRDFRAVRALLAVVAVNEALNFVLKVSFARPRPPLFHEIATLHSYSFPSGHAMSAVAIYGMIAVVLAREFPRWRRTLAVIAPAFALLVGLSRIFLGVHWATDVLAGYAAGGAILLGGIYWLGR
jgi:undecaprenyl-diphosphatase